MRAMLLLFTAAGLMAGTALPGQDAAPIDPCNAMPMASSADAKNFLSFDRFDKELRVAIRSQDALALAFLVTFPLRVNDAGGTISIDNSEALKTHFQAVFTAAVRKAILDQSPKDLGCITEGVGYGSGVIWVNPTDRGYAIWSVNRDAAPNYRPDRNSPRINYVCQTPTHRIVVDTIASGALRYRSWKKPRSITEAPDLEITKGEGTFEGTNYCAIPVFTFKSGLTTYKVEGSMGCSADDGPASPKDATGRLEVTMDGKPPIEFFCF